MLGDSVRRRQPQKKRGTKPKGRWRRLWLGVPLALLLPAAIGYLVAVLVIFPPTETSAGGIPVPDLVGRTAGDAERELRTRGLGALQITELPHPSAPGGSVIAQDPLAGQQLRAGADVRVAISAGRPRVLVPDVTGFTAERAEALLRRLGLEVQRASRESSAAPGRVIMVDPQPGTELTLPAAVTVIQSLGPPLDTLPLPPDTMRAAGR